MAGAPDGDQFHFDPATYLDMIREEVPAYDDFQDAVAAATMGIGLERVLDLGVGTGDTSRRVLDVHPAAELIGIDESAEMLAVAAAVVGGADLRVSSFVGWRLPGSAPASCGRSTTSRSSSPMPAPDEVAARPDQVRWATISAKSSS